MNRPGPQRLETPFGDLTWRREGEVYVLEGPSPVALDYGLGWLHSKLRGRGCQLARAVVQGTLGEELKPEPAVAEVDRFVRMWNFDEALESEVTHLDAGSRARLLAYAQGFNQEQAERRRLPWESPPRSERWQMEDSILLGRTLGFFSWWETEGKKVTFLHDLIKNGAAPDQVRELFPEAPDNSAWSRWASLPALPRLSPSAEELLGLVPRWRASRAWAVKGRFTRSGFPLLGGSYQTDVSQVPGMFLEVVLKTPSQEWKGLSLPGIPALVCGRHRHLAWHAAVSFDPAVDYQWTDAPNQEFHHDEGWVQLNSREDGGPSWRLAWKGHRGRGTLRALMETQEAGTVAEVQKIWENRGSALIDLLAADGAGGVLKVAAGPRIPQGPQSFIQFAPAENPGEGAESCCLTLDTGPRGGLGSEACPPFSRAGNAELEHLLNGLSQTADRKILETIRFLLPDNPAGNRLRAWRGQWATDEETRLFTEIHGEILKDFAESWGMDTRSGCFERLRGTVIRVLCAPASQTLGPQKNKKLAEAVHRALESARRPEKTPVKDSALWRQYPQPGQKFPPAAWEPPPGNAFTLLRRHDEKLGQGVRTFWTASAWTCDLSLSGLRIRNWGGSGENQTPQAPRYSELTRFTDR